MKTFMGALLFAAAAQVHAQALETDLDGNASALLAPRAEKGVRTLFPTGYAQLREKGS
jgi:hypothetical protein